MLKILLAIFLANFFYFAVKDSDRSDYKIKDSVIFGLMIALFIVFICWLVLTGLTEIYN